VCSEGESLHAGLALTLMREILSGGAGELRGLCRMLTYLNLPRADQAAIKMLRALTDTAVEVPRVQRPAILRVDEV
jgi:hypothetical protein